MSFAVAAEGVGEKVAQGAAAGAGQRAQRAARGGGGSRRGSKPPTVLVTTLAVLFASGIFKSLVTENKLPGRRWWVGSTALAAMLSILTDLAPRGGKYACYLVLTGTIYAHSVDLLGDGKKPGILDYLSDPADGGGGAASPSDSPAAAGVNANLEPVFLRGTSGRVNAAANPGMATETWVASQRAPQLKAKRPKRRAAKSRPQIIWA